MKFKILAALLSMSATKAFATDMSVVDVRRNITLADDDTVYKDFYINGGASTGLKKNLVVTAIRKINVRDAAGANSFGEIQVPVGKLKIIAVYGTVSVARELELLSRDELPMLEQVGIMNGDRIDIAGSYIDNSKPKIKRKTAAVAPATPLVAVAVATAETAPASAPVPPNPAPVATSPAAQPAPAAPAAQAPVIPALSSSPTAQKLEKTADSGNKSGNE
jgi:hypothetical protein